MRKQIKFGFYYQKVQRTLRKNPERNPAKDESIQDGEDGSGKIIITSDLKSSPSIPVGDMANTSPMNSMDSPRSPDLPLSISWPQPRSCQCNQGEVNSPSRQLSVSSSGYDSSLNGSFSSLVLSDAPNEEHSTSANIKKCATYPRFDTIEGGLVMSNLSPGMPRSTSASSLEHYKNEMELNFNGTSCERNIPVPCQRNISGSRMSQFTSCDCRSVPPLNTSPRASNSEINNNDENQKENTAYQRFYRAMYPYESEGDGEVAFREGDEVEVIQRSENGWWFLRTSEKVGWGPSNFLQSLSS